MPVRGDCRGSDASWKHRNCRWVRRPPADESKAAWLHWHEDIYLHNKVVIIIVQRSSHVSVPSRRDGPNVVYAKTTATAEGSERRRPVRMGRTAGRGRGMASLHLHLFVAVLCSGLCRLQLLLLRQLRRLVVLLLSRLLTRWLLVRKRELRLCRVRWVQEANVRQWYSLVVRLQGVVVARCERRRERERLASAE